MRPAATPPYPAAPGGAARDPGPAPPAPWWLWPNLLALDAPAVAVVWQQALGAAFGVPVPPAATGTLFLAVWGIYLADRFLDAAPGRAPPPGDRHAFARRHRGVIGWAAGVALTAAGLTAACLPAAYLWCGGVVAAATAGYLLAVHAFRPGPGASKEFLVGLVFAAGVGVPLAAARPGAAPDWLPAVGGFAAVCWLNCRLIDRWEEGGPPGTGPVLAAAIAAALAAASPAARAPLLAAVVLLGLLHALRARLSPRALRVLADATLLTPLALGPWL